LESIKNWRTAAFVCFIAAITIMAIGILSLALNVGRLETRTANLEEKINSISDNVYDNPIRIDDAQRKTRLRRARRTFDFFKKKSKVLNNNTEKDSGKE